MIIALFVRRSIGIIISIALLSRPSINTTRPQSLALKALIKSSQCEFAFDFFVALKARLKSSVYKGAAIELGFGLTGSKSTRIFV